MAAKINRHAKNKRPKIQVAAGVTREEARAHRHANPEMARGLHAIASSSKASAHADSRLKRARTRSGQKARAIREWA